MGAGRKDRGYKGGRGFLVPNKLEVTLIRYSVEIYIDLFSCAHISLSTCGKNKD